MANKDGVAVASKSRGKPNPYAEQITEAISNFDSGKDKSVKIVFNSDAAAKKGSRNLYASFRNRGYKTVMSLDGSVVSFQIVGKIVGGKKTARRASTTASSGSGNVLVRTRQGRGWSYEEFQDKAAAIAHLLKLNGDSTDCQVFEKRPVTVTKTVEGL